MGPIDAEVEKRLDERCDTSANVILEQIRQKCQKAVDYGNRKLEEYEQDRGQIPEYGFASIGMDSDGVPLNMGNYSDVYDDGLEIGHTEGQFDLAGEILDLIKQ